VTLRHFAYLNAVQEESLFERPPEEFDLGSERRVLAMALGATLYTPGTRADFAQRVPRLARLGVVSSVLCLEDAIADADVDLAERNVADQLQLIDRDVAVPPLLFVRVRHPDQVLRIVKELGDAAHALCGFVFPKFVAATGRDYFEALNEARSLARRPLYGMPVLETAETLYAETRLGELLAVRALLHEFASAVLSVRIGATDLCGLFGLRRGRDLTVYDLAVIREAIADVINVFARDDEFSVSGPVWEHFGDTRIATPYPAGLALADLTREVVLDKATGIVGKTVIHPSHVRPVHALYAVEAEEFADAHTVLAALPGGGVRRSAYANKMIESRPHARWAELIVRRAAAYGVLRPGRTWADLLAAGGDTNAAGAAG